MKKFNVSEIDGDLLNCLIAIIDNPEEKIFCSVHSGYTNRWCSKPKPYIEDWSACGLLMMKFNIFPKFNDSAIEVSDRYVAGNGLTSFSAETPLKAVCRAIVALSLKHEFIARLDHSIGLRIEDIVEQN